MYDRTTDPDAHIKAFTNAMAFRTGYDVIWCRAFSLSLEGEALEWFNSFPNNSIENFEGIGCKFKKQFAACNTQDITVVDLMNLKQEKEESLKAFMDRYQKTIRWVKGLTLELALQYVLPALRPRSFKDNIRRCPPKTMEELRERVVDEIRVENMKQGDKKAASKAKGEKGDGRKYENQTGRLKTVGTREMPRPPRFQQYTPLNAPREKNFQEALNAELIPPPKRCPTPHGADLNKHCLYHKNMGHSTEECVTFRDKIEELI
ncbi:uncharacterized protein LOC106753058 [Vigna radiata var. radiata]|uniref:Uncharacterized protein LOC106753058 n=1 Tax=Vigna radiata var. radiata TaxID=3916 RepID=A0A1S3T998_VIGRR|nr:uncharacterized protein LOC106753058 [Vigna radiata var. radiata]